MGFMIFKDYKKTQEEKMKFIARLSHGVVLDIGGSGNPNRFLDLNDSVKEVWLLDVKEPVHMPAKYKQFIKFDLNDVVKKGLPFKDQYFDTVILADVLEHVLHPLAVLYEVHRILKEGGRLIISLPSPKYYVELLYNLLFSKPMGFPDHKILFTRQQMKYFLKIAGFKVDKVIGYSFWIPLLKIGFVNVKRRLPEIFTWQQIYVCHKALKMPLAKIYDAFRNSN